MWSRQTGGQDKPQGEGQEENKLTLHVEVWLLQGMSRQCEEGTACPSKPHAHTYLVMPAWHLLSPGNPVIAVGKGWPGSKGENLGAMNIISPVLCY